MDKRKNDEILVFVHGSGLPTEVFLQYKIISRTDKVRLYMAITQLSVDQIAALERCVQRICFQKTSIDLDGFQVFLDLITPFVKNDRIKFLINNRGAFNANPHSTIAYLIQKYLQTGFNGLVKYRVEEKGIHIDKAVSDTSNFVYNQLKYHIVKYLGIFNLLYKHHIANLKNIRIDEISGFERLISKLEYNAFSKNARIASDYGATNNIISFFEDGLPDSDRAAIIDDLDSYEINLFNKIKQMIES
jgi:hypothetical protein